MNTVAAFVEGVDVHHNNEMMTGRCHAKPVAEHLPYLILLWRVGSIGTP
jgi:hypothetical protein